MFGTAEPPQDERPSFALAVLIWVNPYGPRDNFDLDTSYVISSLIRKCVEAKWNDQSKITASGTGQVTREFIYVEDAAEAVVMAAGKYQMPEPVSLGSGQEISLCDLAYLIKELVCYECELEWDRAKPDGQARRCLDTTRGWQEFGWRARTPLRDRLRRSIEWFMMNYKSMIARERQRRTRMN